MGKNKHRKKKNKLKTQEIIMSITDSDLNDLKPYHLNSRKISDDKKIEANNLDNLRIVLPIEVHNKMLTYAMLIDEEINGLGMVRKDGNNFIVEELFLLDQEVSGAACDIKADAMVKLMEKLIAEGKNPSDIRCWWHSHNTMGVFWSGTDVETGKKYAGSSWLVSIVCNHAGQMRGKVNFFQPFDFAVDNVPIEVQYEGITQEMIDACAEEIKQKVVKHTYFSSAYNGKSIYPQHVAGQVITPTTAHDDDDVDTNRKILEDEKATLQVEMEEGPFGDTIRIAKDNVLLEWNPKALKYDATDLLTDQPMTDKELQDRLGYDYNASAKEYLDERKSELEEQEAINQYELSKSGYGGWNGHLGYDY